MHVLKFQTVSIPVKLNDRCESHCNNIIILLILFDVKPTVSTSSYYSSSSMQMINRIRERKGTVFFDRFSLKSLNGKLFVETTKLSIVRIYFSSFSFTSEITICSHVKSLLAPFNWSMKWDTFSGKHLCLHIMSNIWYWCVGSWIIFYLSWLLSNWCITVRLIIFCFLVVVFSWVSCFSDLFSATLHELS